MADAVQEHPGLLRLTSRDQPGHEADQQLRQTRHARQPAQFHEQVPGGVGLIVLQRLPQGPRRTARRHLVRPLDKRVVNQFGTQQPAAGGEVSHVPGQVEAEEARDLPILLPLSGSSSAAAENCAAAS